MKDLSGKNFGRLTALYRLHNHHRKGTYWLCACDCGNLTEVYLSNLQNGKTKSCRCLNHEPTNIKHGKCNTRLYNIYCAMKNRCYNKNYKRYKDYGARGIVVCQEWKDDFMSFYNWAMDNSYRDDLTIDRIDVNGNYEPSNCKWSTAK